MGPSAAVVGVGHAGYAVETPAASYKELMFEAARRAYDDAGVNPRTDVDSFVTVSEDFEEGTSIVDEYVPDQLGAVRRPVQTIAADGLAGIATAVMLIGAGIARVVAVEGHSKASNVLTPGRIAQFAMDPVFNRPLDVSPLAIAGLEMRAYLEATGTTEAQCASVAARNRRAALTNPRAAHAMNASTDDVLASPFSSAPLRELEVAKAADGCVVVVLASPQHARELSGRPIWIEGVGWSTASASLEARAWDEAEETARAADAAYGRAGISDPAADVGLAEVDDTYAHRQLMHVEALGLAPRGEAGAMADAGAFDGDRRPAINPSGGSQGEGHLHEAAGLARMIACVDRLRSPAGGRPARGVAVVHSWRGVPSASSAVAILRSERESGT
jgi:acetyl-CoA C-acetyltransferase